MYTEIIENQHPSSSKIAKRQVVICLQYLQVDFLGSLAIHQGDKTWYISMAFEAHFLCFMSLQPTSCFPRNKYGHLLRDDSTAMNASNPMFSTLQATNIGYNMGV